MLEGLLSAQGKSSGVNTPTVTGTQKASGVLRDSLNILEEHAPLETDGKWLEPLTATVAPLLADWDVETCWPWADWPDRHRLFPSSTGQDIGIDLVARRRADGKPIAIQCKSRKLGADGTGDPVGKNEISKFVAAARGQHFVERWLVTNGAVPLNTTAQSVSSPEGGAKRPNGPPNASNRATGPRRFGGRPGWRKQPPTTPNILN